MRSVPVQNPLLFSCAYGSFFLVHFYLFLFFYFVHIHRRKAKKKSSELYNIVIIQKRSLPYYFFFSFIKSLKVSLRSCWLAGRDVKEREICPSTKKVRVFFTPLPPVRFTFERWPIPLGRLSPFEIQISPDGRSTLDLGRGLAGSKQKDNPCSKWGRERKKKKSISLDWRPFATIFSKGSRGDAFGTQ